MQTIIAAFKDPSTAQQAVDSLIAHGFSRGAVHLQTGYNGQSSETSMAGTMSTNRTGTADTGFLAGVEHFFSNLFSGDDEQSSANRAGQYVDTVRQGNSVIAVDAATDAELDKATTLLYDLGAIDVDEQSQSGATYASGAGDTASAADAQSVMPVVQEELQVGKRVVQKGGIRVVRRITETPVTELVTLREERAVVERRPVDRAATEADFTGFKEGTIEVREQAEEAVVGKTARVVEEVVVGKQVTEREEKVSDTVRKTDVEVETLATTDARTSGGTEATTGTTSTTGGTRTGY